MNRKVDGRQYNCRLIPSILAFITVPEAAQVAGP